MLKNLTLKKFSIAFVFISVPMCVLAYFYDTHGMLIYYLGFILGMFFQSREK